MLAAQLQTYFLVHFIIDTLLLKIGYSQVLHQQNLLYIRYLRNESGVFSFSSNTSTVTHRVVISLQANPSLVNIKWLRDHIMLYKSKYRSHGNERNIVAELVFTLRENCDENVDRTLTITARVQHVTQTIELKYYLRTGYQCDITDSQNVLLMIFISLMLLIITAVIIATILYKFRRKNSSSPESAENQHQETVEILAEGPSVVREELRLPLLSSVVEMRLERPQTPHTSAKRLKTLHLHTSVLDADTADTDDEDEPSTVHVVHAYVHQRELQPLDDSEDL